MISRQRLRFIVASLFGMSVMPIGCSDMPTGGREAPIWTPAFVLWKLHGIDTYSIKQQKSCFCGPIEAMKIQVTDNEITDVSFLSDGSQLARNFWVGYRTIDQLFLEFNGVVADTSDYFYLRYDSQFSYPSIVSVNTSMQVSDDEVTYHSWDLEY